MRNEDLMANGRSLANCSHLLALRLEFSTGLTVSASDFNGTPALLGRPLFLRSNRTLFCIESMQTAGAGKTQ